MSPKQFAGFNLKIVSIKSTLSHYAGGVHKFSFLHFKAFQVQDVLKDE